MLEVLARDHHQVTEVQRNLERLLDGISEHPDAAEAQRVRTELDTLAALLETHFTYEEKRIVTALNSLDAPEWTTTKPNFLQRS